MRQFLFFIFLISFSGLSAQPVIFPSDNVVNILDYGANLNDGVTDATAAIAQAVADIKVESNISTRKILFFPNGTYLVSDTIGYRHAGTTGSGYGFALIFYGQDKDSTIIKLTDNNPKYQDKNNPYPVVTTAGALPSPTSYTNIAFMNYVINFTIDVGSGNPGAIGLRYIANNNGVVRDVVIRSSDASKAGLCGLDMKYATIAGPALLQNVVIDGFDYGMMFAGQNYGMNLKNVEIHNTHIAGIYNYQHIVSAHGLLISSSEGKAIINSHVDGYMTLLDVTFDMSGNDTSMVNKGYLLAKNIKNMQGAKISIQSIDANLNGDVDFYVYNAYGNLYNDAPDTALNIPVPAVPELPYDDTTNWVNVADFGYNPGTITSPNYNDCAPAINAAIAYMNQPGNENKTTLYFQNGVYRLNTDEIRIHGNVKRIIGSWASIYSKTDLEQSMNPIFIIDTTDYDLLVIEGINLSPQGTQWSIDRRKKCAFIENRSSKDVVLRNIYVGHGKAYKNNGATGRLFIEDFAALSHYNYSPPEFRELVHPEAQPQFEFGNQEVYAWHINPEQLQTHISTDGGLLWIMGLKTEQLGVVVEAKNHAMVEVYGGTILPSVAIDSIVDPIFKIENSKASLHIAEHISLTKLNAGAYYKNLVNEIRGNDSLMYIRVDAPKRNTGYASVINFYNTNPEKKIEVYSDPVGAGSVTGGGLYWSGDTASLMVQPTSGYQFINWEEDGLEVSSDSVYSFIVNGNRVIHAVFSLLTSNDAKWATANAIYPNPAQDIIFTKNKVSEMELYNAMGVLLLKDKDCNSMDVKDIKSGLYFISVDGVVHKVIITK